MSSKEHIADAAIQLVDAYVSLTTTEGYRAEKVAALFKAVIDYSAASATPAELETAGQARLFE